MKVLVGMSGGVDSSVAAALLKQKGYEVIGVSMKIWGGEYTTSKGNKGCYGSDKGGIEDAREIAKVLQIPFHVIDVSAEFRDMILEYFKSEYLAGRTPNPCTRCNPQIKFGILLLKAQQIGIPFDYFATGHYVKVEYDKIKKRYLLKKGKDMQKDQSYFLYALSQSQLSKILFPLGEYTKAEVRKLAKDLGLNVHDKGDSQDFFSGDYMELFNIIPQNGDIIYKDGKVIGEHTGVWNYTIGQRRGLRISSANPLKAVCTK